MADKPPWPQRRFDPRGIGSRRKRKYASSDSALAAFFDGMQRRYAVGEKYALLEAVLLAHGEKIRLPPWVANEFTHILAGKKTIDFDSPYPNKLARARRDLAIRRELRRQYQSEPKITALFKRLADQFNVSFSHVSGLFYGTKWLYPRSLKAERKTK